MATITRGATTLNPALIIGLALVRRSRSIVHDVIGDTSPDVTARSAALRAGQVRTFWPDAASAQAAANALSVKGAPWTWTVPETPSLSMLAHVVGDVQIESTSDDGRRWFVTVGVQEVSA